MRVVQVRFVEIKIKHGENFPKMDSFSMLGSYVDPMVAHAS